MKVALLNSCRYLGGAELWQIRLAKFLAAQKDEVKFLVKPGRFADLVKKEGFASVSIPMAFDLDIFSICKIFRELKSFQPDAVIFNDQRDLRLGVLAASRAKVPLKIQRKGWSFLKGSFRDRFYYSRVDYVAAVSKDIEHLFKEKLNMGDSRLYYLPNGVSLDRFQNLDPLALRKKISASPDEILLGMAGRLEKQKRQADLIRAAQILTRRGHKVRVILAGEGKARQSLEKLALNIGVAQLVSFLGFVEKVEEFLVGLDIFVFCSEQEGMPNAVLEAFAAARPVVAAEIAGVRELIENGKSGLLYSAGDVDALAGLIERLIQDPALRGNLASAARHAVEEKVAERKIFLGFREWLSQKLKEKQK